MAGNNSLNGLDVDALNTTVNAVKEDAFLANFKFRAENTWIDGAFLAK